MAINRVRECKTCTTEFNTSQFNAKYCPDCRSTSYSRVQKEKRQTLAQKRTLKLSQSDEWLWIARECKRSGTVEILQGVDIVALLAVYKARFKTYGYNPETKKSQYHLCHISPAVGKDSVGLLNHQNLFVGTAFHNLKHSNKSYKDRGLCIPKKKLNSKWKVSKETSDRIVLDKVTEYLGKVLIDYAKENPITKSQRYCVAKWVFQNDPDNTLSLSKLESMSMYELRAIRARVQDKEAFTIEYTTKRSFIVMLEECQRLSVQLPTGQHQSDIAFMIPVLQVAIAFLGRQPDQHGLSSVLANPYGISWNPLALREDMSASTFRDLIGFQTFQALQGAPVDRKMIRRTMSRYLNVTSLTPDYSHSSNAIQNHYADGYTQFVGQVPVIKNAIISLGMVDKYMLAEEIAKAEEAAYEESIFAGFQMELCEGLHDYSTIHYEIEDDYIANPNLVTFKEPVFVPPKPLPAYLSNVCEF
ncbi:hypothetical protein PS645_01473 [Pseudomonas fluorescens]|uniref:Uncharacterized protein n=1 Tax=Pseudomonas fluorescens TaxID=294 RepID=A0A5E6R9R3_PSEFL|nr:hypothetical protein [Pseudomonas fluorescens]VVM65016.1 hypothetical protein PS645_01473 [Pseudomonas fluorescens]